MPDNLRGKHSSCQLYRVMKNAASIGFPRNYLGLGRNRLSIILLRRTILLPDILLMGLAKDYGCATGLRI